MPDRPSAPNSEKGAALETLAKAVDVYKRGDTIFAEGDEGDSMFVVASGTVALHRKSGEQDEVLERLGEGDFFGELSVLAAMPRACTAKAASECHILELRASDFEELLEDPDVVRHMLRELSRARVSAARIQPPRSSQPEAPSPPEQLEPEVRAPVTTANVCRLVAASGTEYVIQGVPEALIGRYDHANKTAPDIDLSDLDSTRSLSRRHARVRHQDGTFVLREEPGVANGTFLDDQKLEPGRNYPLAHGCRLRLGLVELTVQLVS